MGWESGRQERVFETFQGEVNLHAPTPAPADRHGIGAEQGEGLMGTLDSALEKLGAWPPTL